MLHCTPRTDSSVWLHNTSFVRFFLLFSMGRSRLLVCPTFFNEGGGGNTYEENKRRVKNNNQEMKKNRRILFSLHFSRSRDLVIS